MFIQKSTFSKISAGALAVCVALSSAACRQDPKPATFSITVPSANTVEVQVALAQRFGLGLSGNIPVTIDGVNYGSVMLMPESPSSGFGFGFSLNTGVFLRDTWVNYQEVTSLPTGDAFPAWMSGPVVDLVVPPANINELGWHFYFGTRSQFYVGAAALISAIGRDFPSLRLEYSFYDDKGRVILGLVFFGPKMRSDGSVEVPGGIFVGTNISPFLPPELQNLGMQGSGVSVSALQVSGLVQAANSGQAIKINGKSVTADLSVSGRDAGRYRSQSAIQGIADRFAAASRRR